MTGLAERWERRVQLAAHPLLFPAVRFAGRKPIRRIPGLGVVVNDAETVREILGDTEHFSKTGPGSPADLWTPIVGPRVLLNMEGTEHSQLRRALAPLFTPRAVQELCAQAGATVIASLRSRLKAGMWVDIVSTARDLALAMISTLAGLPVRESAGAAAAAGSVTSMVKLGRPRLTTRQARAARAALAGLTAPAAAAWRVGDPTTVPGRMRALGLSESDTIGAVAAFVLVGTETMISYLPRLVALAIDSGALAALTAGRGKVADVVAEALRFTVPSPVMLRSVRAPTTIRGLPLRQGERVVIVTANAANPDRRFDPESGAAASARQIWFGAGPHFCLGMPLAMAEIDVLFGAVVDLAGMPVDGRFPELQVISRSPARGVLIPAYRSLVVGRG